MGKCEVYNSDNRTDMNSIVNGDTFRIRLAQGMKLWLFKKAHETNRTVSEIIREAITEYMQKQ